MKLPKHAIAVKLLITFPIKVMFAFTPLYCYILYIIYVLTCEKLLLSLNKF